MGYVGKCFLAVCRSCGGRNLSAPDPDRAGRHPLWVLFLFQHLSIGGSHKTWLDVQHHTVGIALRAVQPHVPRVAAATAVMEATDTAASAAAVAMGLTLRPPHRDPPLIPRAAAGARRAEQPGQAGRGPGRRYFTPLQNCEPSLLFAKTSRSEHPCRTFGTFSCATLGMTVGEPRRTCTIRSSHAVCPSGSAKRT